MLQSDANKLIKNVTLHNIHTITLDSVSKIEKELDAKDVISLVFLLYDAHNVALERLIVYQRVYGDLNVDLNLLYNWAKHSQNTSSWRYQFLEALAICQLYNIIRKLGFDVSAIKQNFMPNNVHVERYVNPMKKALYQLCEYMTSRNLQRLQNTLKTYDIQTSEYKFGEIVLLELLCKKFIIVEHQNLDYTFEIDKLAHIIENFPDVHIQNRAMSLRQIQNKHRTNSNEPVAASTSMTSSETVVESTDDIVTANDFEFLEQIIDNKNIDDFSAKKLKTDNEKFDISVYPIKNPNRVGVCHIINQVDFQLPDQNIDQGFVSSKNLKIRLGSNRDRDVLDETMRSLNFEVICDKNLNHIQMIEHIQSVVQYRLHPDHSIYMLCILSHGIHGHVFSADSVAINIEHIKYLLDKSLAKRKLDIPKVLILQACRVNDEPEHSIVSDAPIGYRPPKLHFLVCWATALELEAFRDEVKGSIFIQVFCNLIKKQVKNTPLLDILTNTGREVVKICSELGIPQTPNTDSTLIKKLYLQ